MSAYDLCVGVGRLSMRRFRRTPFRLTRSSERNPKYVVSDDWSHLSGPTSAANI
jgi:hypothetical protein